MPTYEYACASCQNQWEEIQKISEPALTVCPKCGKDTARRQISGGNFILKGGGWYADLYSSSKPGAAKSESKESKANGSSSSTTASKSDAAPAASSASAASSSGSAPSTSSSTPSAPAPAKKD
jgi:putative FmdB family regulatory protein